MVQITVPQGMGSIAYGPTSFGVGAAFAINYPFFALSDIQAQTFDAETGLITPLINGTHFSVAGVPADDGFSSGTLTMNSAFTTVHLAINRMTPVEKLSNYPTTGAFSVYALNSLFSKFTVWHQEHRRGIGSALRFPDPEAAAVLPGGPARVGKILIFDSVGQPALSANTMAEFEADMAAAIAEAAAHAAAAEASADASAASALQAQSYSNGAILAATQAELSATAANNSAVAAGTASTQALAYKNEAGISAMDAAASADLAQYWANQAASISVPPATVVALGIIRLATQPEVNASDPTVPGSPAVLTPQNIRSYAGWISGPLGIGTGGNPIADLEAKGTGTGAGSIMATSGGNNSASFVARNTQRMWSMGVVTGGEFWLRDETAGRTRLKIDDGGVVSMINFDPGNVAFNMGASNVARSQVGWDSTQTRWYLNINDAAGIHIWTALSINATGVGIGVVPLAKLHIQAGNYPTALIEATDNSHATLQLKNIHNMWNIFNGGLGASVPGALTFYDGLHARERLLIEPGNGNVVIKPRPDNYATLQLQAATSPAILYWTHSLKQYHIQNDGSSLIFRDDSAGANRMWITTVGNLTLANNIDCYSLRNSAGGAGRVKCRQGHTIEFEWNSTQLFAWVDGAAAVLIG